MYNIDATITNKAPKLIFINSKRDPSGNEYRVVHFSVMKNRVKEITGIKII